MITLKNITKTYGGAAQIQALKGINLTIDDGDHDIAATGLQGPIDHDIATIKDTCVAHAASGHAPHEGADRIGHEQLGGIEGFLDIIISGRRKPRAHRRPH